MIVSLIISVNRKGYGLRDAREDLTNSNVQIISRINGEDLVVRDL